MKIKIVPVSDNLLQIRFSVDDRLFAVVDDVTAEGTVTKLFVFDSNDNVIDEKPTIQPYNYALRFAMDLDSDNFLKWLVHAGFSSSLGVESGLAKYLDIQYQKDRINEEITWLKEQINRKNNELGVLDQLLI